MLSHLQISIGEERRAHEPVRVAVARGALHDVGLRGLPREGDGGADLREHVDAADGCVCKGGGRIGCWLNGGVMHTSQIRGGGGGVVDILALLDGSWDDWCYSYAIRT